jgi:hypothetical protein
VAYENNQYGSGYGNNDRESRNNDSIYSKRIKAGKRRTYFFDVKATRGNDYFITITESKKRFDDGSYERHKMFLYKEDFNKFLGALTDAINYVKTDLMPNFDFDAFNHDHDEEYAANAASMASTNTDPYNSFPQPSEAPIATVPTEESVNVEDWKM